MKITKIAWTDHTFNPWIGCTKVSAGCSNCYAKTISGRFNHAIWGPAGTRKRTSPDYWKQPIRWNKAAAVAGVREQVFCASMADVFEGPNTMPESEWSIVQQARADLLELIDQTPNLDWLLLTKRPQNILAYWQGGYRSNVWLGSTIENQGAIGNSTHLLAARHLAKVLFVSAEPLIGPVTLPPDPIDWVIVGGESGTGARPMDIQWATDLLNQSQALNARFFMKQLSQNGNAKFREFASFPPNLQVRQYP